LEKKAFRVESVWMDQDVVKTIGLTKKKKDQVHPFHLFVGWHWSFSVAQSKFREHY